MKKTFSSFKEIYSKIRPFSDIIPNHSIYKAHTPAKCTLNEKETLSEHIGKVNDYAIELINQNNLDEVVDNILIELLTKYSNHDLMGNLIKEFFIGSIVYHDYGKINPNFQYEIMDEKVNFKYDKTIKIDTQHSKLSTYIYLGFYIQKINALKELVNKEKHVLYFICSIISTSIYKHHSSQLFYPFNFLDDEIKSLNRFLKEFSIANIDERFLKEDKLGNLVRDSLSFIDNHFLLYSLVKLNFSLLTSGDFYATNEYRNNFAVQEFGLLDKNRKEGLYQRYWTYDYNQKAKLDWEKLKETTLEQLQKQNKENLNILRSKLLIEGVEVIRHCKDDNLFYLEAPTGSGKTNLSLAIALEILLLGETLNKIFYVFPFTTLVVQTFEAIKKTLGLANEDIIQLHSKSGFHSKNDNEDGNYGDKRMNYMDNLFLNYPITLLTHIKFFDILKGNDKENNYIFHRLANSVVIIDELQSFNPKHWDKMAWMLSQFGRIFNIKFVLMSATLPKINEADKTIDVAFKRVIKDKNKYFQNPNFCGRVTFDFSLLERKPPTNQEEKDEYLNHLADFIKEKSESYANHNSGRIKTIVEFIKKKSANEFYLKVSSLFTDYKIYLLSGEILDPRRKYIINKIKEGKERKILLITTQVVEAGVDIDMDLGFKDRSIIDSDEQLAGRVNRNASKNNCIVYMFDYDNEAHVYRNDDRRKVTKDEISLDNYKTILATKDFDRLYNLVFKKIDKKNNNAYQSGNLNKYKGYFQQFDFKEIKEKFKLIEDGTQSVFVPIKIPASDLDEELIKTALLLGIDVSDFVDGKDVFEKYVSIATDKDLRSELMEYKMNLKKIYGLISQFTFSVYENAAKGIIASGWTDKGSDNNYTERFGMLYLNFSREEKIYSYEGGINIEKVSNNGVFL